MVAALLPDNLQESVTLADLAKARKKADNLVASLDRGMKQIAPLEVAMFEQLGQLPENPQDLPEGEYKEKLLLWLELLQRYELAEKEANRIRFLLRAQSQRGLSYA